MQLPTFVQYPGNVSVVVCDKHAGVGLVVAEQICGDGWDLWSLVQKQLACQLRICELRISVAGLDVVETEWLRL
jgi:hypothetical protein